MLRNPDVQPTDARDGKIEYKKTIKQMDEVI